MRIRVSAFLAGLTLLVTVLSNRVEAQQRASAVAPATPWQLVSPSIVNSVAQPVAIVSITGTFTDLTSQVVFRNDSSYAVQSLKAGLLITVPAGCGPRPFLSKEHVKTFEVSLQPNASATVRNAGISVAALRALKQRLGATEMMEQIAVTEVTFVDGHVWNLERTDHTYRDDWIAKNAANACRPTNTSISLADCKRFGGQLVRIQNTQGQNVFDCENQAGQDCQNTPGGQSCTSSFCPNNNGCSNQTCAPSTPTPSAPSSPSSGGGDDGGGGGGGCDDSSWYCGDDGDMPDQGLQDTRLLVGPKGAFTPVRFDLVEVRSPIAH